MKTARKRALLLLLTVLLLASLLIQIASAMSSTHYALEWLVSLTGGGAASFADHRVNFTVGQSAIGASTSASYGDCLGYWCGAEVEYAIYLPLVLRDHP